MAYDAIWADAHPTGPTGKLAAPLAAMVIASLSATLWLGIFKLAALV